MLRRGSALCRLEYKEMTILGQGNFSKVFRAKNRFDGMEYAIKRSFKAVATQLEARRWQQVCVQISMTVYL